MIRGWLERAPGCVSAGVFLLCGLYVVAQEPDVVAASNRDLLSQVDAALANAKSHEWQSSRIYFGVVDDAVLKAQEHGPLRAAIQDRLIQFLDGEATEAGRWLAVRALAKITTPEITGRVATWLASPDTFTEGLFILRRIPGPDADARIADRLASANTDQRVALLGALAERQAPSALDAVLPWASDADVRVAEAAIRALNAMDTYAASDAIAAAQPPDTPAIAQLREEAVLRRGQRYAAAGRREDALAVFDTLTGGASPHVRHAAFLAKLNTLGPDGWELAFDSIDSEEAARRNAAVQALQQMPQDVLDRDVFPRLASAPPERQLELLDVLADKFSDAAYPLLAKLASNPDPEIVARAEVLIELARPTVVVEQLAFEAAGLAQSGDPQSAKSQLDAMDHKDVPFADNNDELDELYVELGLSMRPEAGAMLIESVGRRGPKVPNPSDSRVPELVSLAGSQDMPPAIRGAAAQAVADRADQESLRDMVMWLADASVKQERAQMERAVLQMAKRYSDEDPVRDKMLEAALEKADTLAAKESLYRVMGELSDAFAIAYLRNRILAEDASKEEATAATRALAGCKNPEGVMTLYQVSQQAPELSQRVLAIRGLVRLVEQTKDARSIVESVRFLESALAVAERPEEKNLVIGAVGRVAGLDGLTVLARAAETAETAQVAGLTAQRLLAAVWQGEGESAAAADGNAGTARACPADSPDCTVTVNFGRAFVVRHLHLAGALPGNADAWQMVVQGGDGAWAPVDMETRETASGRIFDPLSDVEAMSVRFAYDGSEAWSVSEVECTAEGLPGLGVALP